MKVKFWGVRGSIPSPLRGFAIREKMKRILTLASPSDILDESSVERFLRSLPFSLTQTYGGNTTCLEIRSQSNDLIIIDAGTGLRDLGNRLMAEEYAQGKGECHFLFTHSHWDHIQGLPFFVPAYIKGNTLHIHAISEAFESRLKYQHNFEHFPVNFEDGLQATKVFHQHRPDESWKLYNIDISTHSMRHPGGSWSYKLEEEGKVLIFGSDAEFRVDEMENLEASLDYFRGADVLIFDTQYTFEEQLQKIDWGHSSASIATDIAMKAGVKKLVLFHHDPSYTDEKLDEVYMRAIRYKEMMDIDGKSDLEIHIAYEGLEIVV